MQLIWAVCFSALLTGTALSQHLNCKVPADIIILMDGSDSIQPDEWKQQTAFVRDIIDNFEIGPNLIKIGMVVFSSYVSEAVDLYPYKNKQSLMSREFKHPRGGTNTASGIVRVTKMFREHGRTNAPHVLVLITDGRSMKFRKTIEEAAKARLSGIIIFVVAVGQKVFMYELRQIVSAPDMLIDIKNFGSLQETVQRLKASVCKVIPQQTTTPATTTQQTTTSPAGNCQVPGDIVILIDGSDSITDEDWKHGIDFVTQLIDHLDIARDGNHIGAIVYSSSIGDMIHMNPYKEKPELKRLTRQLRHPKDGTNTGAGIERTRQMLHDEGRPDAPRIAIVITDGRSKNKTWTMIQSNLAKQAGITMVTVGVGAFDIADELTQIASRPSLYYPVGNYQALTGLIKTLKTLVCKVVTTMQPTTPSMFSTKPTGPVPPSLCDGCIIDKGIGYNPYPEDCTKYVQCFKEGAQFRAVIMPCPFGSFWDTDAITCRDSTTVTCTKGPCTGMAHGAVVPYIGMGCRSHWICYAGMAVARCCSKGERFRAGLGCIPDASCEDVCPPDSQSDVVVKCDLRRHPTDKTKYIQITPGGDLVRPCAPGSVFMEAVCTCRMQQGPLPPPRECLPSVNYTFNGNLEDTSHDKSYSGMRNIALTSHGSALFNGDSSINMWRFAGIDFGSNIAVKMRYKIGLPVGGQTYFPSSSAGTLSGNMQSSGQVRMPVDQLPSSKTAKTSMNAWRLSAAPYRIGSPSGSSVSATLNSAGAGGNLGMGSVRYVSGGRRIASPTITRQTGTGYQIPGGIRIAGSSLGNRINYTRINTTYGGGSGAGAGTRVISRQISYESGSPQMSSGVRGVRLGGHSMSGGYNLTGSGKPVGGSSVYSNRTLTRTVRIGPRISSRRTLIGRPPVTFRKRRNKRQTSYPQALITNCGVGGEGPSILILVSPNEVTFKLKTSSVKEAASMTLPTASGFNDVSMTYDGNTLTVSANGQESSTRLTGTIERRQAGLLVGSCDGFSNFRGEIDYVYIWQCLPRT